MPGYGFDNIADVLSLSPVLMEKYVSAADKVSRTALFGPPTMKPTLTRLRSDGRRVRRREDLPRRLRPDRTQSAERLPRDRIASRSTASTSFARRWRDCGRLGRNRSPSRSGSTIS